MVEEIGDNLAPINGKSYKKSQLEEDTNESDQTPNHAFKRSPSSIVSGLKAPVKPFGRPRVTWDNCLKEIESTAYTMSQDSLYRTAMCAQLCRKARKEVIKKDNQAKGMKEYRRLISAHIAYGVKREFSVLAEAKDLARGASYQANGETNNIQGHELKPFHVGESQAKMGDALKAVMNTIAASDLHPEDRSEDQKNYEGLRLGCLKEVHKVLGKWNKQTVKNFLKAPLFENVEKGQDNPLDGTTISHHQPGSVLLTPGMRHSETMSTTHTYYGSRDSKKDEIKDRNLAKMIKAENSEEILTLYITKDKVSESFKRLFKASIDQNPIFPKNYEDVPVLRGFMPSEEELYENKTFFGDFQSTHYVETGLASYIEQMTAKVKE